MKDKTQVPHSPFRLQGQYVTIRRCRRQVGGAFGTVRDWFWRKEEPWIVVQLPSGTRVAVRLCWTDLPPDALPKRENSRELCPSVLIPLVQYCRQVCQRRQRA